MKIEEVKTARKVGEFYLRQDNSPNKIKINYEIPEGELRDTSPRVYLLVADGVIKKIGGSIDRGGIKATMSFYEDARTGSPGPARFIIHGLIEKELREWKKVEVYMIKSEKVKAKICGLFDCEEKVEIAAFKEMEDICKFDYFVYKLKEFLQGYSDKCNKHVLDNLKAKYEAFITLRKDYKKLLKELSDILPDNDIINMQEIKQKIKESNPLLEQMNIPLKNGIAIREDIIEALERKYKQILEKPKKQLEPESRKCKELQIFRFFPEWNFQENRESYPTDLYSEYLNYHENRLSR